MRRSRIFTAVALATLLAGCGGDGDTKTVTVSQSTPPTQTTPGSTSTTAAALPDGRAAVEGRYLMRIRSTDYEGQNIVSGMPDGEESTWPISTVCTQQSCRLEVRRELESGAFESVTLREVKDRSYATSSTGTAQCIVGDDEVSARQRLSIRVSGIADIGGRPTAQRVDAYMTIRAVCGNDPVKGVISWRGTRLP